MALQQFTNLNFEDIKASIKDYLRENSNFSDMDFEGSNLSVIINLLAYNSYTTAYNTNMVVNETFIDSATLRENVVSLARNIGYVPRSKRAAKTLVDYTVSGINTSSTSVVFQPGLIANGTISNVNYLFSIPEKVTGTAKNGKATGTIEIFQGQYLENTFVINDSLPNQRFIIPNSGVDTSTIRVGVRENNSSSTTTEYKLVDNIIGVTSTSNIYLIQETTDEKYEISTIFPLSNLEPNIPSPNNISYFSSVVSCIRYMFDVDVTPIMLSTSLYSVDVVLALFSLTPTLIVDVSIPLLGNINL